MSWSSSFKK
jgi:hypothetical protein